MDNYSFFEIFSFFIISLLQAFRRAFFPEWAQPHKSLEEQVILLTGAGSGIGLEIAKLLAKKRANLLLWDISNENIKKTAELCKKLGSSFVYAQLVDCSNRESIYAAINKIEDISEGNFCPKLIDIVINNAGIRNKCEMFQESSDKAIEQVINTNLMQLLWTTKAFLPYMLERKKGHIVVTASVGAFTGLPTANDYTAAKYGVFGFMEALQNDVNWNNPIENIHFTTVCPGFVSTPLIKDSTLSESFPHLSPTEVAESTVNAIEKNQRVVFIPNVQLSILYTLKGILPWNIYNYLALGKMRQYC